jgi:hypothetical protein
MSIESKEREREKRKRNEELHHLTGSVDLLLTGQKQ